MLPTSLLVDLDDVVERKTAYGAALAALSALHAGEVVAAGNEGRIALGSVADLARLSCSTRRLLRGLLLSALANDPGATTSAVGNVLLLHTVHLMDIHVSLMLLLVATVLLHQLLLWSHLLVVHDALRHLMIRMLTELLLLHHALVVEAGTL